MSRLNWRRALLGGVLAAVLWGVLYAPVHPLVEVHTTLGRPVLQSRRFGAQRFSYVSLSSLQGSCRGSQRCASTRPFAALRCRPSTAAIAALSVWFLTSWMHLVWAVFTLSQSPTRWCPLWSICRWWCSRGWREHGFIENDPSPWSQLPALAGA